jgi:uncharacterized protein (TIGR01777 family)
MYIYLMKKIILAGGTGFVGKYLETAFKKNGNEVIIISRQHGHISWSDQEEIITALENSDLLINLAGKSVNCRYNQKNKEEILNSRVQTTDQLGEAILKCKNPPPLWINSSTATIYRHAEDHAQTESTGEIGKGFSVNVATTWEKTFFDIKLPQTRQVALRIAIVLGKDGGVIIPYTRMVKMGLGGTQGNGKQRFSWIHIEDLYRIILFIKENPAYQGVFNCSSPHPVTNAILMKTFRNLVKPLFGLPAPSWMLKMGAAIIGTETELILKSRWVVPEKLLGLGFEFKHPQLEETLQDILDKKN